MNGISLDQTESPEWAAREIQPHCTVQGNLEPMHMVTGGDAMLADIDRIREALGNGPHVFNLGHGITPDADTKNVDALLKRIRG